MTRATSREAYHELIASGALVGKQARVLGAIVDHGPGTSGEIIADAKLGANINLFRARFTELLAKGLIREVGQRVCKVSGRVGLVWEATDRTTPLKSATASPKRGAKAWRELALDTIGYLARIAPNAPDAPALKKRALQLDRR